MKKFLLLINLLVCFVATSQTTLERGDIMILGLNASTTCSPYASNVNTAIYLLPLVDIQVNTTIDITDNGFNRVNTNRFGTYEGTLRFQRNSTGGLIASGTVIPLNFTNYIGSINTSNINTYVTNLNIANPGWTITILNNRTTEPSLEFNFSTASDQIILMQGGNWTHSSTGANNANYNGKFLFGFNSKTNWMRTPNTAGSQESALPGYDLTDNNTANYNLRQYHFTPHQGGFVRSYYSGPRTPTSKYQWLIRILNSRNWTSVSNCSLFVSGMDTSPLSIIEELGDEAVCKDDELILDIGYETTTPTNSIQTQYEWFERATPGNSGGTSVGTTRQFIVPTGAVGTNYYYCMITYRLSWTNSRNNGSTDLFSDQSFNKVASGYYEVKVNPNPVTSSVVPL